MQKSKEEYKKRNIGALKNAHEFKKMLFLMIGFDCAPRRQHGERNEREEEDTR